MTKFEIHEKSTFRESFLPPPDDELTIDIPVTARGRCCRCCAGDKGQLLVALRLGQQDEHPFDEHAKDEIKNDAQQRLIHNQQITFHGRELEPPRRRVRPHDMPDEPEDDAVERRYDPAEGDCTLQADHQRLLAQAEEERRGRRVIQGRRRRGGTRTRSPIIIVIIIIHGRSSSAYSPTDHVAVLPVDLLLLLLVLHMIELLLLLVVLLLMLRDPEADEQYYSNQ